MVCKVVFTIFEKQKYQTFGNTSTGTRNPKVLNRRHGIVPTRETNMILSKFKMVARSVREPASSRSCHWGQKAFGVPNPDNWCNRKTGGIMIANYSFDESKPGPWENLSRE